MIVSDQVASAVRRLPVAPKREAQSVPAHPGELRDVIVDHLFAIGVDVTCRAIVGCRRQDVVRAEKRDFAVVVAPADDAGAVEVYGAGGRLLGAYGCAERGECGESECREQSYTAPEINGVRLH